jgi:hypothetical protein
MTEEKKRKLPLDFRDDNTSSHHIKTASKESKLVVCAVVVYVVVQRRIRTEQRDIFGQRDDDVFIRR